MNDVLIDRAGALVKVTLNRPQALNALTLDMVRTLQAAFDGWKTDDSVACVVITGAGDKAFCAGGDVRAVRDELVAMRGAYDPSTVDMAAMPFAFFREEYQLNATLGAFPKPIVALVDGVTMGGGLGLSVHGSHRIATDRTLMAMPEAAIGLFPDVGASLFLNAAPGGLGRYLAATGARLKGGADPLYAGLATHYAPAADAVMPALDAADWSGDATAAVDAALKGVTADPGAAPIAALQGAIDRCFGAVETPADSLKALAKEGDQWASDTLAALRKGSPTTVALVYEQLRRVRGLPLLAALTIEFRLAQFCMGRPDFAEGVRAVLIDKDNAPHWSPARLEDVDPREIGRAFGSIGHRDLNFRAIM